MFNVSLTTNYFILRKLGFNNLSIEKDGLIPTVKSYGFYILNKLKLIKHAQRTAHYKTNLKLDPTADNAMVEVKELSMPVFS